MVLWQPPWLTKSTPRWLAIGLQKLNTLVVINCLQKCCIAFQVLIKQTICLQQCLKYFSNTHHSWVQDWSSCCKLLLRARNYKISNLKCYIYGFLFTLKDVIILTGKCFVFYYSDEIIVTGMDLLLCKCTVAEDRMVVQRTLIPHPKFKCSVQRKSCPIAQG